MDTRMQGFDAARSSTSGKAVKLEISRTGILSLFNMSAVPPVEMMFTPCRSSSRAKAAMPVLSETEMSARQIFTGKLKELRN